MFLVKCIIQWGLNKFQLVFKNASFWKSFLANCIIATHFHKPLISVLGWKDLLRYFREIFRCTWHWFNIKDLAKNPTRVIFLCPLPLCCHFRHQWQNKGFALSNCTLSITIHPDNHIGPSKHISWDRVSIRIYSVFVASVSCKNMSINHLSFSMCQTKCNIWVMSNCGSSNGSQKHNNGNYFQLHKLFPLLLIHIICSIEGYKLFRASAGA